MPEKIGKYEIEDKIGVGGFGVVYKGRDPFIKRSVAIKTCQVEDEEIRRRFFREAELAGNLHHPNIATIYDFGIEGGIPYIVLEFLTGEDLDRKIKAGQDIPVREKIRVLVEVCKGLHYAHEHNIIHRDVKPANIRIQTDGSVKIMDFGIAKSIHLESHLTQTGMTLGTAAFLAPEQIKGERLDRRTDIFSLGVLMYNLFTYRKPFTGEVISAIIYSILNKEPEPIRSLIPDFPRNLDAVVTKCLSKNPDHRFNTAQDVQRALERVREELLGRKSGPLAEELRPTRPMPGGRDESTAKTPTLGVPQPGPRKPSALFWILPAAVAAALVVWGGLTLMKRAGTLVPRNVAVEVQNPLKTALKAPAILASADFPPPPALQPVKPPEKPAPPEPVTAGVAIFASAPCDIQVDGRKVGSFPPQLDLKLTPGPHEVTFKTTFASHTQSVTVVQGRSNRFGHQFPSMGKLEVRVNVGTPYGTVYVDGNLIGDTPKGNIVLPVGKHLLEIKRPGYLTISREIDIKEDQTFQYTNTLRPEPKP